MNQIPNIEETNTREGIEEILRKFKTTIMWETEHEEGLLMSNHDALEWLRVALTNLGKLHQEELSELGAGITNGYEGILKKTEQTHRQELQKARAEAWQEAVDLADKIELREPDGGTKQWMAFKAFRNTLRYKIKDHAELDQPTTLNPYDVRVDPTNITSE